VTVNGKFPGPRVTAREGDNLQIKVVNHVSNNISIHWYKETRIIYINLPLLSLIFITDSLSSLSLIELISV